MNGSLGLDLAHVFVLVGFASVFRLLFGHCLVFVLGVSAESLMDVAVDSLRIKSLCFIARTYPDRHATDADAAAFCSKSFRYKATQKRSF